MTYAFGAPRALLLKVDYVLVYFTKNLYIFSFSHRPEVGWKWGWRQVVMACISWATHLLQWKCQYYGRPVLGVSNEPFFSVRIAFCNLKRVKTESPVIANQPSCGEQVLEFCTNRPSRSGRGLALSAPNSSACFIALGFERDLRLVM